jgi:hypothetical protein
VLWAGADDGPIHVTRDGGKNWTRVDGSLPAGTYKDGFVSKIEPSRTAAGTAYVAYDLHYHDDLRPYLFKTTDFGRTWTAIANDLPAWGSTYVIREDPHNPRVLYVGTESGLFVSIDGGAHWVRWKSTMPFTAVRSLVVHPRDRELVVGTFGLSICDFDVADLGAGAEVHRRMRDITPTRQDGFDPQPLKSRSWMFQPGLERPATGNAGQREGPVIPHPDIAPIVAATTDSRDIVERPNVHHDLLWRNSAVRVAVEPNPTR